MRKPKMRFYKYLVTLIIIGSYTATYAQSDSDEKRRAVDLLKQYIDLLITENYESANMMWTDAAQERSARFGISYKNIPMKIDAGSPLVRLLDAVRNEPSRPTVKIKNLSENLKRVSFSQFIDGRIFRHNYFLRSEGEWLRLTYRQDEIGSEWPLRESRFMRVRANPGVKQYINEPLLSTIDDFVMRIADSLKLSENKIQQIEEQKMEFYYCDSDSTVMEITGVLVKGTLDLASNDIISASFPHYHEMVHLLVNIKLGELPLYTLPLFREGLAVYYGGRWGKEPAALTDLAVFLYRQGLVELDSILTVDDFTRSAGADIAYPVAGIFTGFLLNELGIDSYLQLYLRASGEAKEVSGQTVESVKDFLITALDVTDWTSLIKKFELYLDEQQNSNSLVIAGKLSGGKVILDEKSCLVVEKDEWLGFEILLENSESAGSLFFGGNELLQGKISSLFEDQFGDTSEFSAHQFSVRFDKHEVGVYDYITNQLVAKYIVGISPSGGYYDAEKNRIRFKIRSEIFKDAGPNSNDYKLLER